jgi:hypothetical protein
VARIDRSCGDGTGLMYVHVLFRSFFPTAEELWWGVAWVKRHPAVSVAAAAAALYFFVLREDESPMPVEREGALVQGVLAAGVWLLAERVTGLSLLFAAASASVSSAGRSSCAAAAATTTSVPHQRRSVRWVDQRGLPLEVVIAPASCAAPAAPLGPTTPPKVTNAPLCRGAVALDAAGCVCLCAQQVERHDAASHSSADWGFFVAMTPDERQESPTRQ